MCERLLRWNKEKDYHKMYLFEKHLITELKIALMAQSDESPTGAAGCGFDPAGPATFMAIDHEIFSTVILFSFPLIQIGQWPVSGQRNLLWIHSYPQTVPIKD